MRVIRIEGREKDFIIYDQDSQSVWVIIIPLGAREWAYIENEPERLYERDGGLYYRDKSFKILTLDERDAAMANSLVLRPFKSYRVADESGIQRLYYINSLKLYEMIRGTFVACTKRPPGQLVTDRTIEVWCALDDNTEVRVKVNKTLVENWKNPRWIAWHLQGENNVFFLDTECKATFYMGHKGQLYLQGRRVARVAEAGMFEAESSCSLVVVQITARNRVPLPQEFKTCMISADALFMSGDMFIKPITEGFAERANRARDPSVNDETLRASTVFHSTGNGLLGFLCWSEERGIMICYVDDDDEDLVVSREIFRPIQKRLRDVR